MGLGFDVAEGDGIVGGRQQREIGRRQATPQPQVGAARVGGRLAGGCGCGCGGCGGCCCCCGGGGADTAAAAAALLRLLLWVCDDLTGLDRRVDCSEHGGRQVLPAW